MENDQKEQGPEIHLMPTWVFRLGAKDTLLVLRALGGRMNEAELPLAKALGDRLTELRAIAIRPTARSLEIAVEKMNEANQERK